MVYINIKLLKNNEIIKDDTVDYKKDNNKILFEVDEMNCFIEENDKELVFQRENNDYCFNLVIGENNICNIKLKKEQIDFPIQVEDASYDKIDNKIIIYYMIESLDEANTIEITIER